MRMVHGIYAIFNFIFDFHFCRNTNTSHSIMHH